MFEAWKKGSHGFHILSGPQLGTHTRTPPSIYDLPQMNGAITMDDFLGPHPRRMSKPMRQVINLCLHRDPRKR